MFESRLHVARSFGYKMFQADSAEDLTAEQYYILFESLVKSIEQSVGKSSNDRTVSFRTSS